MILCKLSFPNLCCKRMGIFTESHGNLALPLWHIYPNRSPLQQITVNYTVNECTQLKIQLQNKLSRSSIIS